MRRAAAATLGQALSGAILLREAARTSRRWQTYLVRTAFSGILMAVLLIGMWGAVNATRMARLDTADLAWLGRGLFVGFSVTQTLLAIGVAPLLTSAAIIEETEEGTLDMLVLTPLRPGQILGSKVLSRIGVLLTVVFGALPVMALVVNLGGVSTTEVVAVTVHTVTAVVGMAALGAFFALFTRSPGLAAAASAGYAVPFFVLVPGAYAIATFHPSHAAQFSPFASALADGPGALLTPLSFLPSLGVLAALVVPLFELTVSGADRRQLFADRIWQPSRWFAAGGVWLLVAFLTLPFAVPLAGWLGGAAQPPLGALTGGVRAVALAWIWLLFVALAAVGTWGYLRVGVDVVDGIDELLRGSGLAPTRDRVSRTIGGANPVWWREARVQAWLGTGAPVFVVWVVTLLVVFQSGTWILPGGLVVVGALNAAAATGFAGWLAARSVAEERRRGTFELLVCTTLPSRSILVGKLAGASLPTVPLLLLALPCFAFGLPWMHVASLLDGSAGSFALAARGVGTWCWVVPVWALTLAVSFVAAARLDRPQTAFSVVLAVLGVVYGLPAVLARVFPDQVLVTGPARLIAPPLAGGFAWWQLGLSIVATSAIAVGVLVLGERRLRGWIGAGVALLIALASTPALAVTPDATAIAALEKVNRITMVARPLADGISREERPTSLWVRIDNLGPATTGTVSLAETVPDGSGTARTWQRRVELPEGARKELLVVFRPGIGDPERILHLSTREGRIAVAPFQLRPVETEVVGIAVIGTDAFGLPSALPTTTAEPVPGRGWREPTAAWRAGDPAAARAVHTGLVAPFEMPRVSAGWSAVDWVVWPDADPSRVEVAQTEALRAWVADGGHLLVAVSDTWREVADSPLAPMLPLAFGGRRDADVGHLAQILELPEGPAAPIAIGTPVEGRAVQVRARTADGEPLWASAAYGLGSVHVVTLDLDTEPTVVRGREASWRRLLTLPPVGATTADHLAAEPLGSAVYRLLNVEPPSAGPPVEADLDRELEHEAVIRRKLADIPGVAPLPLRWLVAFSVVYLLAIGPLDYLVLRAIGRQPLTWITFPLLIVGFTAASLALVARSKGGQAVMTRVEVLDLLPDTGLVRGTTWLGVFSTRKTALEIVGGFDDAVLTPLGVSGFQTDVVQEAGGGPGSLAYGAETWTLGYARSEWTTPLAGGLVVRTEGDRTWVRNTLGWDLDGVALSVPVHDGGHDGGQVGRVVLGPLAHGAEIELPPLPADPDRTPPAPEDRLGWAVHTFAPSLPATRGSLRAEQRPLIVGVAARAFEPVVLSGFTPVERPLTIVRVAVDLPSATEEQP